MVSTKLRTNVTDPVADLLTRIRNANLAYKDDLLVPSSKMNRAILGILEAEGYIGGFEPEGEGIHQAFRVRLKYGAKRERTITGLRRISKPGRRVYA
ncbi:MAG TPA: 30S ribosomal protein S8, partial [Actinomycetota bacterium]|nr:30S ribosomal protein S8 [Actinomycetota bacterium]